jgi:outer membrane protein OmpA-like peptidoglycan-associated protein
MKAAGTNALSAVLKRTVLLLFIAIGCRLQAQAQVRLGLLGGIHSSKVLETNKIPGWDSTVKPFQSSRAGFQLGLILELPIGHSGFFFQPALTYITKGRKYYKTNDSITSLVTDTVYNKQTLNLNYIEIPLNLTYKVPLGLNRKNSFFLSAGPYVSFIYSGSNVRQESLTVSTHKYSSDSEPVTVGKGADTYKTFDFGVNGRAGFELGNVMLSAYFSQGLNSFYNAAYSGTFHHQVIGASLGIWLSSSKTPPPPPKKKDTDKDGVTDDQDQCPLVPGKAAWHGCPVPDTDHDGIDDEHDSCRNLAGVARYNGCPIPDSDHDGVNDEEDKCPHQAGVGRYNGCPIPDRDGDGINDEEDKCPDSAGIAANQGCPVVKEIKKEATEQINYIAHNILFTSASDQLTDSSYIALTQLADLLLTHPEWHLAIEGYTDNSGVPAKNLVLSQNRADAVKNFLISKGIARARLTATGFGQQKPLADNRTLKGRAANRRVELRLSLEKQ